MITKILKEDVTTMRSVLSSDMLSTGGCILSIWAVLYTLYHPNLTFGDKMLIILSPLTLVILIIVLVWLLVWLIRVPSMVSRSKLPKLNSPVTSVEWLALMKLSDAPFSNDEDTLNLSMQIISKLESSLISNREFVLASEVIFAAEKIKEAAGNRGPISEAVRSFAYEHNIFPGGRPLLLKHSFDLVCSVK